MFPVWAPMLVMIGVTITGLIFAIDKGITPLVFFILFAIACVLCTLLVEPRGLFLTVVTQTIYYVIGTVLIGWIAAGDSVSAGGTKTKVLTTAYPAIEHFPWLAVPFLISVIIAVIRWRRFNAKRSRALQAESLARRRRREADENNRLSYTSARSRSRSEEFSGRTSRAAELQDADEDDAEFERFESEFERADYARADYERLEPKRTRPSASYRSPSSRARESEQTHTVDELLRKAEQRRAARSELPRADVIEPIESVESAEQAGPERSTLPRPARRYRASE
ncbi:DUF6542 domain-containing protein [uncultured Corynebacterium sp.]|uniref:DUF6542 domain-containing protein n=1 Tax=uncultured Corynebacterium sp. TaxID=159447 RepID=UPI0025985528|nr:DUF6542 domain-containing protein [uncultured Corynebacterium sp.]